MNSRSVDPPEGGPLDSRELPKDVFAPSERDRILQAMAAACAERGYAEVRVEEVIERAGVTYEAFAANFASKEECGAAVESLVLAETTAAASGAYSADASEWESVLRGIRAMLELWAARPSFADMGFIQSRQMMPPRAFDVYASGIQLMASMVDRLREYSPEGAQQPASVGRGVLGGIEMLIRREIVAGRAERLPKLLPNIIYAAMVPFLGQEEALRYASLAREPHNDGGEE